jgi:outer membrane lipoprotein-sorting protein
MRSILFVVISFFVSGCIMSSSAVSVSKLLDRDLGIKSVTIIDNFYSAEV